MGWFSVFSRAKTSTDKPKTYRYPLSYSGGTTVSPTSAMMVSAFYRGVTYISTQIAKLPWEVKDRDNKVVNNQLSYLLRTAPNSEMSSFMFRNLMVQWALIWGNAYAEIERNMMGAIVGIWPIHPSRVTTDRDSEGRLYYRVSSGSNQAGPEVILFPKEIFHIRNFHTIDGVMGQGLVAYASETLGISLGADRFANSLFTNGGMPSGVLKVQGALSDEAYKRLKDQWDKNYAGRKVGGTALLEEGATYEAISHDPQVLQFLESRKFSVVELARFLGLPPSKLFDTDVATYANIEQSNLEVATDTLDAWARNFETEADIKLLSGGFGDKRTEMDLYAIFRGDMTSRSTYFTKMMQVAALTPNEIRKKEGMAPYEGGDRFYIATNNYTPHDRMDEVIDSQVTKSLPQPEQKSSDDEVDPVDEAVANYLKSRARE